MSVVRFGTLCAVAGFLAGCIGGSPGDASGGSSSQAASILAHHRRWPTPPPTVQAETVVVTVGGSGTITSSPAGISCAGAGSCSYPFPVGTTVTLSAAPASGQTFLGWSGACSGTTLTCAIDVSTTENVSASFAPVIQTDSLQVTVGGAGSVTSNPAGINCTGAGTCSQSYASGTTVTLSALPASGNAFVGWTGACSGTGTSCTVVLSSPSESVGASFAAAVQYFALQVADGGNGTVTSSPTGINCSGASASTGCSQSFTSGTTVQLTAAPASGYVFSTWSGACSGSTASCTVTMNAAQGVGATFAASSPTGATPYLVSDPYPLTGAQPSYFVVSCDGGAAVDSAPAVNASGAGYLDYSLSGLAKGAHVCSVAAANASGAQSVTETVSFTL